MSEEAKTPVPLVEEEAIVTEHVFGGIETLVKTGRLPLKNEKDEIDGLVFFVAYTKKTDLPKSERPLMFAFNGGPGSPSIWLHLGALGPKRAPMLPDGNLPPPPYSLVDNPHTWLDEFDIVFVDPIGTGYSRAKDEATGEKFWGVQGDLDSMAEFIRLYLTREERTSSPIYLCGESYGTTRCAGLAGILTDKGTPINGVVLVSSILNFQTAEFRKGNDLPYPLFLPTYTATAHYHGMIEGDLLPLVEESREFALGEYWSALAKGSRLGAEERNSVRAKLSALTGLSETYLDQCDLRPVIYDFCKELLREQGLVVGRLDSRIKGVEDTQSGHAQRSESDPSMDILMGPYRSLFIEYVRTSLGYKTDLEYQVFGGVKKPWNWGSAREGYPDTSGHLRRALSKNPYMKVLVVSGYYDLATPFFATEYTMSHLGLNPGRLTNIAVREHRAGHMMYIDEGCLAQLKQDIAEWKPETLPAKV